MSTRPASSRPRGALQPNRARGRGRAAAPTSIVLTDTPKATHVETVGIKRPGVGTGGKQIEVFVNCFPAEIPSLVIHHYDVVISSDEKVLPARVNLRLIQHLQTAVAPGVFTPRVVYDGRKNVFAARELPFGGENSMEFHVPLFDEANTPVARPAGANVRSPKLFTVKLTKVAEINTEVLKRFIEGIQSADSNVLTAITALNVVVRMEPILTHPFNIRSFFTKSERKDIGGGLELWRGLFQSVRPSPGRLIVNVDISTGLFYKAGPLDQTCLAILKDRRGSRGNIPHRALDASILSPDDRRYISRKISGVRVLVRIPGSGQGRQRVVKGLTEYGASKAKFRLSDGRELSVAQYFKEFKNCTLQHVNIVCAEVGAGNIVPLELCDLLEGQMIRKQIPGDKIEEIISFSTQRPQDRLRRIQQGTQDLNYGQSEYIRSFKLDILNQPMKIKARIISPPQLKFKNASIIPNDGSWNMKGKQFFMPVTVKSWALVVFGENEMERGKYSLERIKPMVANLVSACGLAGITIQATPHIVRAPVSATPVANSLNAAGTLCFKANGRRAGPQLIVVVLPDSPLANEIYTKVKHFGDVERGVPTQCMKSNKCFGAKEQYFANVALKLNVKLGGINAVADPRSRSSLFDPAERTIVMGADVIHPSPGSEGRPSFTALVGNIDENIAKYVADMRVQEPRQEIIQNLKSMAIAILNNFMEADPRRRKPRRIIFYRDGVSEGQFQHVLDLELPALKAACKDLEINAKITFIIVGKRHHIRFFPTGNKDADEKTGNCLAGTVIDTDITHPLEYDFYLQSHRGLLGTSRPSHYSVLYDDNKFTPDTIQSLTYTLCHLYARSTRSVSIPAPVYYADIVCSRSKNHFNLDDQASDATSGPATLQDFIEKFKPAKDAMRKTMYFT